MTLIAAPGAGSIFKSWFGCTSVSGTSCTVSMTGAKSVTATFQPAYVLTEGGGGDHQQWTSRNGTRDGTGHACTTGSTGDCTEAVAKRGATVTPSPPSRKREKGAGYDPEELDRLHHGDRHGLRCTENVT